MAGYFNYSMSNNAMNAYSDGEKPLSRWSKQAILNEVAYQYDFEKAELLEVLPLKKLQSEALIFSSWHHTSKMYNATNFYKLFESFIEDVTAEEICEILNITQIQLENKIKKNRQRRKIQEDKEMELQKKIDDEYQRIALLKENAKNIIDSNMIEFEKCKAIAEFLKKNEIPRFDGITSIFFDKNHTAKGNFYVGILKFTKNYVINLRTNEVLKYDFAKNKIVI